MFENNLYSAPRRYIDDQSAVALREMRDMIDVLRHEVNNHEQEIKTYEEKIRNLETIIDSFSSQSQKSHDASKDALKSLSSNIETRISNLESTQKSLIADLKVFKNHANDTSGTISNYKQKLAEIEKILEMQDQNMESLQTALKSIMDILQIKNSLSASSLTSGNTYKIQPGDSLEKIARKHQTTIQAIKEINGLTNDRIIVGQTLKIP